MAPRLLRRRFELGQNGRFHQRRHGIRLGTLSAEIPRLSGNAESHLESRIIRLHLVVGEGVILQDILLAQLVFAIPLIRHGLYLEVIGRETEIHAVPVHARTAKAVAEQERAELAHGQGPHFFRIAERNRLFGQILHKPVIDGIPPFIVDILEILHAPAVAALKPNDGKPGFGAFGKGDAPGEAHAHSNHIHLFQFFGHVVLLDYSMLDRDTGGTFSNVSLVMRYV